MELDDGLDDLLAEINEPSSPKKPRSETINIINLPASSTEPGTSSQTTNKSAVSKSHCVLVNQKQRGNPLLKFITSVVWEYEDIIPDYEIGKTIGILFLSVRYHNLNPDYINNRLKELGKKYELRVLLVQVDLKDPHAALKNLTRICLLTDITLMLAWSAAEAAKIIENYKIFENKPPDKIMEKMDNDPHQKIINALSSIKPVNKADALTLLSRFETLENIIKTSESKLADCPGFGLTKAKKLYKALHEPFLKKDNLPLPSCSKEVDEFAGNISIEDVEKLESETAS